MARAPTSNASIHGPALLDERRVGDVAAQQVVRGGEQRLRERAEAVASAAARPASPVSAASSAAAANDASAAATVGASSSDRQLLRTFSANVANASRVVAGDLARSRRATLASGS